MLLSIIIPIYNGAKYINQCINNIQKNITFKDYELILINDGSSDDTNEIILSLCNNNSHIRYFNQENHGVSYSRNIGILNAKGIWVQFLDVDDIIKDSFYQEVYTELQKEVQLIIFNYDFCNETNKSYNNGSFNMNITYKNFKKHLFRGRYSGFIWDKIYNREYLLENHILFRNDLKFHEDCLFNYNVFNGKPNIIYINKCLYTHYINENSVMYKFSSSRSFNHDYLKVLDCFETMLQIEKKIPINNVDLILYSYYNYIQQIRIKMAGCDNITISELEKLKNLSLNVFRRMSFPLKVLSILKKIRIQ